MFVYYLNTYATRCIWVGGVTIPAEESRWDSSYNPCISYRKNASMVKRKMFCLLFFFRLIYGNAANHNPFVKKLDM